MPFLSLSHYTGWDVHCAIKLFTDRPPSGSAFIHGELLVLAWFHRCFRSFMNMWLRSHAGWFDGFSRGTWQQTQCWIIYGSLGYQFAVHHLKIFSQISTTVRKRKKISIWNELWSMRPYVCSISPLPPQLQYCPLSLSAPVMWDFSSFTVSGSFLFQVSVQVHPSWCSCMQVAYIHCSFFPTLLSYLFDIFLCGWNWMADGMGVSA